MKQVLIALLVIAACSFLYHVKKAGDVRVEIAALKAEVADKTSWGAIAGGTSRAFFDGLTFGMFADEGIFSESKKFERWSAGAARREASLRAAFTETVSNRNWSLVVAIVCGCGILVLFRAPRHGQGIGGRRDPHPVVASMDV